MFRRLVRAACLVGCVLSCPGPTWVSARTQPASLAAERSATETFLRPAFQPVRAFDGLARPRALAFNPADGLVYVALSTADAVAVVEPGTEPGTKPDMKADLAPRVRAFVPVCAFPDALAALPQGGVLVSCRFDPALRRIEQHDDASWAVVALPAAPTSGARGLLVSPGGAFAYVASPPAGGVHVLTLPEGRLVQTLATGLGPRALRWLPAATLPGQTAPLLLVSNFIAHTVSVHMVGTDGRLSPAQQTIATAAPVLGFVLALPELWLLTHEDRELSRARGPVEGLDSGLIRLRVAPASRPATSRREGAFFVDPGPQRRAFANFSERREAPVVELAAAAVGDGTVAVLGAGSDNLWLGTADGSRNARPDGAVVAVGSAPSDVVALPRHRFVTADRLSDTLTFVTAPSGDQPPQSQATLSVAVESPVVKKRSLALPGVATAEAERLPAPLLARRGGGKVDNNQVDNNQVDNDQVDNDQLERLARDGERLFFSTALVPHNVAEGALSLYTCAACHDDERIDGRRHPSKKNRFFSMTKTCLGLGTTPPFLSLGEPATLEAFADNIVGTHAQGAERDPEHFDVYPVDLRVREREREREAGRWVMRHLSPTEVRAALAAYMASIPPAPSPFVELGRTNLTAQERRGLHLFREGCTGCHQLVGSTAHANPINPQERERRLLRGQVALTSPGRYDVGTPVLGEGGNNPPSLRGVWEAAPFFSDGSAPTLDDVLRRTDPGAARVHARENATASPHFNDEDRAALRAFLQAL